MIRELASDKLKLYVANTPIAFQTFKKHFGEPRFAFFNQAYLWFDTETKEWGTDMDFQWLYRAQPKLVNELTIVEKYA